MGSKYRKPIFLKKTAKKIGVRTKGETEFIKKQIAQKLKRKEEFLFGAEDKPTGYPSGRKVPLRDLHEYKLDKLKKMKKPKLP
jgi:hypothetical protein